MRTQLRLPLNNFIPQAKMHNKLLTAFILLLTLVLTPLSVAANEIIQAPTWQLTTQSGDVISSEQFKGQAVILHFWATWCPYCKKLQPTLVELEKKYANQGVKIIAISFNEDEGALPQNDIASRGFDFITAVKGEAVAKLYGVSGTPTTFFIDKNNRVIYKSTSSKISEIALDKAAKEIIK